MLVVAEFDIVGISDLMFGKHVPDEKRDAETHDAYESRIWPKKIHSNGTGQVFLNPFAIKNCLEGAAQWRSDKIKGESRKTYTKRFVSGILCVEKIFLTTTNGKAIGKDAVEGVARGIPIGVGDVEGVPLFVPSDGKRGGSKRVYRIFPTVQDWSGHVEVNVFDEKIGEDVFLSHIKTAGKFIGLGAMRVGNGGINGRFSVENFVWRVVEDE